MSRKICVVTGTRAEFGLLRWLMQEIKNTPDLTLQVVATGMHLSPEYGQTYCEIEQAGFVIDQKVEMLLGANSASAITKSIGLGTIGFADAYANLKPDLIVVLGDRFELLSAVTAALIAGIPVAHLHGGETTEGAFDEAIRHSITKMSHLHFVAASDYARRVIQLGEQPERVFLVGGLGIDAIKRSQLLDRKSLEEALNFKLGKKNLLVTFHPVTLDEQSSACQMQAMLAALAELQDTHLIFTMPNADTGGHELTAMLENFTRSRPHTRLYSSLGQMRYLSCMQFIDGVVGNSSSGLAEAPSMHIGTINIGDRQKGRLSASSVIHCAPNLESIRMALQQLYHPAFRATLPLTVNPYGDGGACEKIVEVMKNWPLEGLIKKRFYDLPLQAI
ncbi:UDP-N-acetylglucosamine 2-epimerase [Vogesella sp. EB]|uniref:GDP/UDP-N,N'-diacetylbacillosamine 2-epimerase (Hydrolysing) n=1 Tax=Vogesella indigofera TaxID=45465 RepID=A0A495BDV6_VOGIN|nr:MULTISPECIES: UDP-N-acetylglucosamine 2-epimerase [Vogesella]KMJ53605.1 UDP-N-acetylglucosamine 2-epimerase [Vogesella sp. EB]RKQ58713.1 GDP/UDP-N,N'-diacetylbacillosamine 2-epimerase (hydrolysing) [Vogesella indigofera]